MKGYRKGDSVEYTYESDPQNRFGPRFCDGCFTPAFTHVDGVALCRTHANRVIRNE